MKRSISIVAVSFTTALLLSAADPDNRLEVRQARLAVLDQIDTAMQTIQQGAAINELSPTELNALRGDLALVLGATPADIQNSARDAAGPGLDLKHHMFVDCTRGVLTAWRFNGQKWEHAGFSDPSGQLTESGQTLPKSKAVR